MNKIFKIKYVGRLLAKIICKFTGGEMESDFFRTYTKEVYNVSVGKYTYGSCFRTNFCSGGAVTVGRYCSIANNVCYIGFDHPLNQLSTSPIFFENYYLNRYGISIDDRSKYQKLDIGNDVWIGSNVTILSKCHSIGNGAIIGAGSIVNKDIPPYAIAVGNPCKIIKYRFDNATIDYLQQSKWWEKEPDELMKLFDIFVVNPKNRVELGELFK